MNRKTYFLIFLSTLMAQPTAQGSVSVFEPQRSLRSTESVLKTLERRGIGGLNQTARLLKSNKGWVIGLTTLAGIVTFPSHTVFLTALSGCFLIYIYGWEFFKTIFQLIEAPYNALMAMLLSAGLGRGPASWIALLVYLSVLVAIVVYARTSLKLKKDRKDPAETLRAYLNTRIRGEKSLVEKEKLAKIKALVFLTILFALTLVGLKVDSSGLPDPPRHPIVIRRSNPNNNRHNPLLSQDEAADIKIGVSIEIERSFLQEAIQQSPSPDSDHVEINDEKGLAKPLSSQLTFRPINLSLRKRRRPRIEIGGVSLEPNGREIVTCPFLSVVHIRELNKKTIFAYSEKLRLLESETVSLRQIGDDYTKPDLGIREPYLYLMRTYFLLTKEGKEALLIQDWGEFFEMEEGQRHLFCEAIHQFKILEKHKQLLMMDRFSRKYQEFLDDEVLNDLIKIRLKTTDQKAIDEKRKELLTEKPTVGLVAAAIYEKMEEESTNKDLSNFTKVIFFLGRLYNYD